MNVPAPVQGNSHTGLALHTATLGSGPKPHPQTRQTLATSHRTSTSTSPEWETKHKQLLQELDVAKTEQDIQRIEKELNASLRGAELTMSKRIVMENWINQKIDQKREEIAPRYTNYTTQIEEEEIELSPENPNHKPSDATLARAMQDHLKQSVSTQSSGRFHIRSTLSPNTDSPPLGRAQIGREFQYKVPIAASNGGTAPITITDITLADNTAIPGGSWYNASQINGEWFIIGTPSSASSENLLVHYSDGSNTCTASLKIEAGTYTLIPKTEIVALSSANNIKKPDSLTLDDGTIVICAEESTGSISCAVKPALSNAFNTTLLTANTSTSPGPATRPKLFKLPGNKWGIVWNYTTNSGTAEVFYRIADKDGIWLTGETSITTATTAQRDYPSAASDDTGNVAITYSEITPGQNYNVKLARFTFDSSTNTLTAQGSAITAHTYVSSNQIASSVQSVGGNWDVTLQSYGQDEPSSEGVIHTSVNKNTGTLSSDTIVNSPTSGHQTAPRIFHTNDGGKIITYNDNREGGGALDIYIVKIDKDGVKGTPQRLTTSGTGDQQFADCKVLFNGEIVCVWMEKDRSTESGGSSSLDANWGIYFKRFNPDLTPVQTDAQQGEYRVNTTLLLEQSYPSITPTSTGFEISYQHLNASTQFVIMSRKYILNLTPRITIGTADIATPHEGSTIRYPLTKANDDTQTYSASTDHPNVSATVDDTTDPNNPVLIVTVGGDVIPNTAGTTSQNVNVTVTVTDSEGASSTTSVTPTITNQAPTTIQIPDQLQRADTSPINEGEPFSVSLTGIGDPDPNSTFTVEIIGPNPLGYTYNNNPADPKLETTIPVGVNSIGQSTEDHSTQYRIKDEHDATSVTSSFITRVTNPVPVITNSTASAQSINVGQAITPFTVKIKDPNNRPVTILSVTGLPPGIGQPTESVDGITNEITLTFSGTIATGGQGIYNAITITFENDANISGTHTLPTLTVPNITPTITFGTPDIATPHEGDTVRIPITVTDDPGDTRTYNAVTDHPNVSATVDNTTDPNNPVLIVTINGDVIPNTPGTTSQNVTVTVTTTDHLTASSNENTTLVVSNQNPTAGSIANQTTLADGTNPITVGALLEIDISGVFQDSDPNSEVTIDFVSNPLGFSLDTSGPNPILRSTIPASALPAPAQSGTVTTVFRAIDEHSSTSSPNQSFDTTIINLPPTLTSTPVPSQTVSVGHAITPFAITLEDPEHETITITSITGLPSGITTMQSITPGTNALTLTFSGTPDSNTQGNYSITVFYEDPRGNATSTTIDADVANEIPDVDTIPDKPDAEEGETLRFPLSATDPDTGDTHTFQIISTSDPAITVTVDDTTDPNNPEAVASIPNDFVPTNSSTRTFTFTYRSTDNHGGVSAPKTTTVTVNSTPPTTTQQANLNTITPDGEPTRSIRKGDLLVIDASGLYSSTNPTAIIDIGFGNNPLGFVLDKSGPTPVLRATQPVGEIPENTSTLTLSTSYYAINEHNQTSDTKTFTITATNTDPDITTPIANRSDEENIPVSIPLNGVGSDAENHPLTYEIVSTSADAPPVTINNSDPTNPLLEYTIPNNYIPLADINKTFTITYRVKDNRTGVSSTETVTVTAIAPPPDITNPIVMQPTTEGSSLSVPFGNVATGKGLSIQLISNPLGFSIDTSDPANPKLTTTIGTGLIPNGIESITATTTYRFIDNRGRVTATKSFDTFISDIAPSITTAIPDITNALIDDLLLIPYPEYTDVNTEDRSSLELAFLDLPSWLIPITDAGGKKWLQGKVPVGALTKGQTSTTLPITYTVTDMHNKSTTRIFSIQMQKQPIQAKTSPLLPTLNPDIGPSIITPNTLFDNPDNTAIKLSFTVQKLDENGQITQTLTLEQIGAKATENGDGTYLITYPAIQPDYIGNYKIIVVGDDQYGTQVQASEALELEYVDHAPVAIDPSNPPTVTLTPTTPASAKVVELDAVTRDREGDDRSYAFIDWTGTIKPSNTTTIPDIRTNTRHLPTRNMEKLNAIQTLTTPGLPPFAQFDGSIVRFSDPTAEYNNGLFNLNFRVTARGKSSNFVVRTDTHNNPPTLITPLPVFECTETEQCTLSIDPTTIQEVDLTEEGIPEQTILIAGDNLPIGLSCSDLTCEGVIDGTQTYVFDLYLCDLNTDNSIKSCTKYTARLRVQEKEGVLDGTKGGLIITGGVVGIGAAFSLIAWLIAKFAPELLECAANCCCGCTKQALLSRSKKIRDKRAAKEAFQKFVTTKLLTLEDTLGHTQSKTSDVKRIESLKAAICSQYPDTAPQYFENHQTPYKKGTYKWIESELHTIQTFTTIMNSSPSNHSPQSSAHPMGSPSQQPLLLTTPRTPPPGSGRLTQLEYRHAYAMPGLVGDTPPATPVRADFVNLYGLVTRRPKRPEEIEHSKQYLPALPGTPKGTVSPTNGTVSLKELAIQAEMARLARQRGSQPGITNTHSLMVLPPEISRQCAAEDMRRRELLEQHLSNSSSSSSSQYGSPPSSRGLPPKPHQPEESPPPPQPANGDRNQREISYDGTERHIQAARPLSFGRWNLDPSAPSSPHATMRSPQRQVPFPPLPNTPSTIPPLLAHALKVRRARVPSLGTPNYPPPVYTPQTGQIYYPTTGETVTNNPLAAPSDLLRLPIPPLNPSKK